ncbi:hypothetical protein [Salinigranum salinum]|uniref:hypothetical protein n=1 Tax=Salinigranum salinum TaxID=1364937 RepID=UPI0012608A8E|nr:hypothetical protein [Salinigranum salinum]
MDRSGAVLFGVAGLDLAARIAGELLGFGTTVGLAVPVVLAGRLSFGLSTLGAALGWLLLWLVLFLYAPVFFPGPDRPTGEWVVGIPNRLVVATGALGVGLTLEGWIAAWESQVSLADGIVTGVVYISPLYAAGLLVAILVGYFIVVDTRPSVFAATRLPVPNRPTEGSITADRYVFLVLTLGLVLSVMSVLFPLPELLLVGLQLGDVVYGLGMLVSAGEFYVAARQDFVEGMTGAVLVIWQEIEDISHLVYILAPLLWVWYIAVATITAADLPALVRTAPLDLIGVLVLVTTVGGYVTFHSFRLSERVRARMTGDDERPRMPLFLLPAGAGAFVVMAVLVNPASGPDSVSTLAFSPGLWALAAAGTMVAVIATARPRRVPSFERVIDDQAVAALSTTVFLLCSFLPFFTTGAVEASFSDDVLALSMLTVLSLAFWIGPPVFLGDRSLPDKKRLKTGLKRSGAAAVVTFALAAIPVVYGDRPYSPLWELYLSVFGVVMLVSGMCFALFAVIMPFRLNRG